MLDLGRILQLPFVLPLFLPPTIYAEDVLLLYMSEASSKYLKLCLEGHHTNIEKASSMSEYDMSHNAIIQRKLQFR